MASETAPIKSLELQVEAQASKATKSLESLEKKLEDCASAADGASNSISNIGNNREFETSLKNTMTLLKNVFTFRGLRGGNVFDGIINDTDELDEKLTEVETRISRFGQGVSIPKNWSADKLSDEATKLETTLKGLYQKRDDLQAREQKRLEVLATQEQAYVNKILQTRRALKAEENKPDSDNLKVDALKQKLDELGMRLRHVKREYKDLQNGKPLDLQMEKNNLKIAETEAKLTAVRNRLEEIDDEPTAKGKTDFFKRLATTLNEAHTFAKSAAKSLNKFGSAVSKLGSIALHPIKALKQLSDKLREITGLEKRGGGLLGRRTFGQFVGMIALRRAVMSVIKAITAGIKEGSENLTQYSQNYASAINGIKSSLATLKNAWAAAFAPIVEVVAPYLQKLIDMVVSALNAIGRFFAALTGKGFAVQAVKVFADTASGIAGTGNAASGAKKKLDEYKKTILSFDELHVLNDINDDATAGGGGGGAGGGGSESVADMFTTVELNDAASDLGKRIRDAILKDEWEDIGLAVSQKLTSALQKIKWDKVEQTAGTWGTRLGRILNGAIHNDEMWITFGDTIAGGINTALAYSNNFMETTDWKGLGSGLAGMMNRAIDGIKWSEVGNWISNKFNVAIDTFYGWVTRFDFSKFGSSIGTALSNAINNFHWNEFGGGLGTFVTGLFETLKGIFDETDWKSLGKNIKEGIKSFFAEINWETIGGTLRSAFTALFDVLNTIIPTAAEWDSLADYIFDAIIGSLSEMFGDENSSSLLGIKIAKFLINAIETALKTTAPHLTLFDKIVEKVTGVDPNTNDMLGNFLFGDLKKSLDKKELELELKVKANKKDRETLKEYNEAKDKKTTANFNVLESEEYRNSMQRYRETQDKKATLSLTGKQSDSFKASELAWNASAWTKNNKATKTIFGTEDKTFGGVSGKFYSKDWQTKAKATKEIGGAVGKTYTSVKNEFGNKWWSTTGKAIKTVDGKSTVAFKNTKSAYEAIKNKSATVTTTAIDKNNSVKNSVAYYKTLSNKTVQVNIVGNIKPANTTISGITLKANKVLTPGGRALEVMGNGGVLSGGKWKNIAAYADGGVPNDGQLFLAREAGPELVGTLGGHTAVMNNNQIVASVSAGVENAVRRALSSMTTQPQVLNIEVKTQDDEVLARAVQRGNASLNYRNNSFALS